MIFTKELLIAIEKNITLKKQYATALSIGQNKLIAIPVIVIAICAFAAYSFYDMAKVEPVYRPYWIVSLVVAAICLIAVVIIQKSNVNSSIDKIDEARACLGKKIYGNEQMETHYCIYTTGNRRYDADFIEDVAYKIFNLEFEIDDKLKQEIDDLFAPSFADDKIAVKRLPSEFTAGEDVYRKEIKFLHLSPEMKAMINENEDKFILLAFENGAAALVKSIPVSH